MIGVDTIEARINQNLNDQSIKIMTNQKTHTIHRNAGGTIYNSYTYRLGGGNDDRLPLIKYTHENGNLRLLIPSLPYFMFGSSLIKIGGESVPIIFEKITKMMKEELDVELEVDIGDWKVTRLDLYHDFQVGKDVRYYLDSLCNINVPTYVSGNIGRQTVFWRNDSREIKFYDKHTECVSKNKTEIEIEQSRGILRFEVGTKTGDFYELLDESAVILKNVLSKQITGKMLSKFLNRIDMNNLLVTTEGDMRTILTEKYKSAVEAHNIVSFIKANQEGYDSGLSRTTKHRYHKKLKDAGLAPIIGERKLRPLKIDGDLSA